MKSSPHVTMRNGRVGLNAQLKTRLEWPSNSPTLVPESHLVIVSDDKTFYLSKPP